MKIWPQSWTIALRRWKRLVGRLLPGWLGSGGDPLLLGLAVTAALLTVWMTLEVSTGSPLLAVQPAAAADSLVARVDSLPAQDSLQYCLEMITGKNLFRRPRALSNPTGRQSETPARAVASVLAEQYQLAGIVGGDPPRVLLRHKRTNTLHYASVGEYVGELVVKEIRDRSVVMEANGEEIELSL